MSKLFLGKEQDYWIFSNVEKFQCSQFDKRESFRMSKIFCILNVHLQGEEFLRICLGEEEFLRYWCRIFSTPILGVEIFLSKFILSKKLHHALSKIFCRGKKPVSKKFCRNSGVLPFLRRACCRFRCFTKDWADLKGALGQLLKDRDSSN